MPDLPARSIADIRLSDLLDRDGCPLCLQATRSAASYIDSFLYEGVNDVGSRRELDQARGFCRAHSRQVLAANRRQSGGTLGSAILFGSILSVRGRELDAALEGRGNARRKRVAEAARAPACPVCRIADSAVASAIGSFHGLASVSEWRDALARAPFCLDHLLALIAHRPTGDAWKVIEDRQAGRVQDLRNRLESFIAQSSHDRRHRITEDEMHAADEAAGLLGGTPAKVDARRSAGG